MSTLAMEADITCTICDHSYNSDKRQLVLPCSHSFCQDCLQQVETAGAKRCPVCRKDWSGVRVTDLSSGCEVTPVEVKEGDSVMKAAAVVPPQDACEEHELDVDLWCESCEVSACKKCWRRDHRSCEFMLLEEKCDALKEVYSNRIIPLKEGEQSKVHLSLSNTKEDLEAVRGLQTKLLAFEEDLMEYKSSLESWQSEVNKVVASEMSHERNIRTISNNIYLLDKLEAQFPDAPTSLLLPIADAYQNSADNADSFISNLKCTFDASATPLDTAGSWTKAPLPCSSLASATEALKEGEVWTIANRPSAAAVRHLLHNTSVRPKEVEITYTDIPEHTMGDIKTFFSVNKQYKVDVKVEMDCFYNSEKPSADTIAMSTARLYALLTQTDW